MSPSLERAIRLILWDVGGVLSPDIIEAKLRDLARAHQLCTEDFLAVGNALRPAADRGELGESEFWAAVLQRNGVEARPGDLEFASYLEADGDLLTLARAAAREVRIGILSNDSREMARARRLRFGFDRWFAPIIISSDLGLIKPEPGIYLHALKAAACAPPQCLFIDDRPENIAGAQAVGMQTHLFRGLDLLRKELEDRGIL